MSVDRLRLHALLVTVSPALWACASPLLAPAAPETSAREFAASFLRAFEDLDMPRFIECFAQDATVFFPTLEPPMRYDGRRQGGRWLIAHLHASNVAAQ